MSPIFELDPKRPPSEDTRARLLDQLRFALQIFDRSSLSEAVHEARKAGKRSRALCALVEGGQPLARGWRRQISAAAQELGPIRDAQVIAHALEGDPAPTLPADHVERVRRARAGFEGLVWQVASADWSEVDDRQLIKGLREGQRQLRRVAAEARVQPSPHSLHEWRKRAKASFYHLQLFRPAWPELLDPWIDALDGLQEALGDHHDVTVLIETIGEDARHGLLAREEDLRRICFARGVHPLALLPRAMSELVGALWGAARRH